MERYKNLLKIKDAALSCVQCGNCQGEVRIDVGRIGVCPVLENTPGFEPYFARGKNAIVRGLLEGRIEPSQDMAEVIFQCTICNNCKATCHQSYDPNVDYPLSRLMDHAAVWEALRADLMEAGLEPMQGHRVALKSLENYDNPYEQPRRAKSRWAKGLDIKDLSSGKEKAQVLLYVGCTAGLLPEMQKVAQSAVQLLKAAGVDFGYLGEKEPCCGSMPLRVGQRELFSSMARRNMEQWNQLGVDTIVTTCAGCFKTLFQDYYEHPELGQLRPEVLHITQYLAKLVEEGRLSFKPLDAHVTYHDPCHLARHCGLMETPRLLMGAVPGLRLTEMERIREKAWCCGAGGGVKSAFSELAQNIAQERLKEAQQTGAHYLLSTCPFCLQNFKEGIQASGSKMEAMDLVELLAKAV